MNATITKTRTAVIVTADTTAIVTDTPEILAALTVLRACRAHRDALAAVVDAAKIRRDENPTGKGSRTLARAYSAALAELDDFAQGELDYVRRDVEMAVRMANPGAESAAIMLACRAL